MTETPWPKSLSTITLFVEDLAATRQFYLDVFGIPVHYEDGDSAVFDFGNTLVNLLQVSEAPELVEPVQVGGPRLWSEGSAHRGRRRRGCGLREGARSRGRPAQRPGRPAMGRTHRSVP